MQELDNEHQWLFDMAEIESFAPRSTDWDELRDSIIDQPGAECAACGGKKNLEVHHIRDFSEYPHLELDPDNLIILCRSSDRFKNLPCHRLFGHYMNWKNINPNVERDVSYFRRAVDNPRD